MSAGEVWSDAGLEAGELVNQLVLQFAVYEMESQQRETGRGQSGAEKSRAEQEHK